MSLTGHQSLEQFGWTIFINNKEYAIGQTLKVNAGPADLIGKKLKIIGTVPRIVAEDFCKRAGWLMRIGEREYYYAAVLAPEDKPITALDILQNQGARMIEV